MSYLDEVLNIKIKKKTFFFVNCDFTLDILRLNYTIIIKLVNCFIKCPDFERKKNQLDLWSCNKIQTINLKSNKFVLLLIFLYQCHFIFFP